MKATRILPLIVISLLLTATAAIAGDFAWVGDFNDRTHGDPSDFRERLEARFRIGPVQIGAVIDNADTPADAYVMLRLCEMSRRPVEEVIDGYRQEKGKGWGVLARQLGIKPGSPAFNALKQGQDLYDGHGGSGKSKGKGKGRK